MKELNPALYAPLEKFTGSKITEDHMKNIAVKQKGNMFLYNYTDAVIVPRNDPILVKCRGLVLDETGKVLNYPFNRFFNDWEKEAVEIDWPSAIVQEKLDGSLISLFWNGNDWEATTRGSFYDNSTPDEQRFDKWFFELLPKTHWPPLFLDKTVCYMFELISKNNRIVTKYDSEFITLLAARNLTTLHELEREDLQKIATSLNVKTSKTFWASNLHLTKGLLVQLRNDEEGFVVVDSKFNRLKIKNETYLKMAKIKMLNDEDIFNYCLNRNAIELDPEFLKAFPEVQEKIGLTSKQIINLSNRVKNEFDKIKDLSIISRKEFAMQAIKSPARVLLFSLLDGRKIEDAITFQQFEGLKT